MPETSTNKIVIDKNHQGNLSISKSVVKKLIHNLLVAENYQVSLDNIKIISNHQLNKDLEAQIKILIPSHSDLINIKQKIINLILKRITSVLNINFININLIFGAQK